MRKLALAVAVGLVLAACASGSDTTPETPADAGASVQTAGSASGFCSEIQDTIDDLDALESQDPDLVDLQTTYALIGRVYKLLQSAAPAELQSDLALLIDATEQFEAWAKDPSGAPPLDEAANRAFDAAADRIGAFLEEECGFETDGESDTLQETGGSDPASVGGDGPSEATHVISAGGATYTEDLAGEFEVSCEVIGDTDSGYFAVYLDGPDFQTSVVANYHSGVEPGTYDEGQIWVFASDPAVEDQLWHLQESDGVFVLDRAEKLSDDEWLLAGGFAGAVEDPTASVEATFTCVALLVDF